MKEPKVTGKQRPWLRYVLLGLGAYVAFLLITFPADRGYAMVQGRLQQAGLPLKLYGVDGTLWKGQADGAMAAGQTLRKIHWDVHQSALVFGRGEMRLGFRDRDTYAEATVGRGVFGGTYLEDVEAQIPMGELLTALRIPAIKADGRLRANLETLEVDGQTVKEAEGVIGWFGAATQFPQNMALGDLVMRLTTGAEGVKGVLKDGGGPLEANGELTITPDGQYQFKGTFAAREGANSPLGRSLRMMGRPGPGGKVQVAQSGKLSDFGFLFGK